jgi:hypothetical protein
VKNAKDFNARMEIIRSLDYLIDYGLEEMDRLSAIANEKKPTPQGRAAGEEYQNWGIRWDFLEEQKRREVSTLLLSMGCVEE